MHFLLLLFLSIFLTACSFMGPVKTPPIHTYVLATQNTSAIHAKTKGVLLVMPSAADPAYQTSDMIYTQRPFTYDHFAYHRWAAPPASMLTAALAASLQNTGCFEAVVTPPFSGKADALLDTHLRVLQQEFQGETSRIHLRLQYTWIENAAQIPTRTDYVQKSIPLTDTPATHVKTQDIEVYVPAAQNTPYAGVVAANRALEIATQKIEKAICQK